MGVLEQLFERRNTSLSLKDPQAWKDLGIIESTASGVSVSPSKALHHSAIFACTRIIAETVASLPLIIYERLERGKRRAPEHALYSILHDRPNEAMTALECREALQGHLCLWGNAYAQIVYGRGGQVEELWPLRPDGMLAITRVKDGYVYHYQLPSGEMRWLPDDQVWHLRGIGADGLIGYSVVSMMRQAIGLGMAAEEYGARFFSNDATSGIILMHPGALSPDAKKNIRESWEGEHQGLTKKHRMAILEEGMKAEKVSIPPDDSQWIETRKFQIAEYARAFRVPLAMLEEHDKAASYASVEQFMLSFVIHTVRPWLVRWEQSIKHKLMLSKDRGRFFPEHLVDALLRGDIVARYQAYTAGRQWGWFSANDIRELENMNPIAGGDVYMAPLNMVPVDQLTGERARIEGDDASPGDHRGELADKQKAAKQRFNIARSYKRVLRDAAGRALAGEIADLRRAAEKELKKRSSSQAFDRWLDEFYRELPARLKRTWKPAFYALGEAINATAASEIGEKVGLTPGLTECLDLHIEHVAARHVSVSRALIRKALAGVGRADPKPTDPFDWLMEELDDWEEARSAAFSTWEAIRTSNLMAKATYFYGGARSIEWVRLDENPFCPSLDGRVLDLGDSCSGTHFLLESDVVTARDARAQSLSPLWNVATPPLFEGCECQIVPAVLPDTGRARRLLRGSAVSAETRALVTLLNRSLSVPDPFQRVDGGAPGAAGRV